MKSLTERVGEAQERIKSVQRRATDDHGPGAGMVRGPFGEYVLLFELQDLITELSKEYTKELVKRVELARTVEEMDETIQSLQRVDRRTTEMLRGVIRERDEVRDAFKTIDAHAIELHTILDKVTDQCEKLQARLSEITLQRSKEMKNS